MTTPDDVLRQLREAGSTGNSDLLLQAIQQMLGAGRDQFDAFSPQQGPSRRRPRRADVVTYRVRVDLDGTKPPLWRRLELASDLLLDEVHDVLQVAFGWADAHLHRFTSGSAAYSFDAEHYLCEWEANEGESQGVPEEGVRLDEVLADVGDRLWYLYDYGDDWHHSIKLEAVEDRTPGAARAVCTRARRPGPPENCGGVYGYELIVAALDPTNAHHSDAVAEIDRMYGSDFDLDDFPVTDPDVDIINAGLADLGLATPAPLPDTAAAGPSSTTETTPTGSPGTGAELPVQLSDLVSAVRSRPDRQWLRELIARADLGQPMEVDAGVAADMIAPYTWLLERVGDDGIKLTAAGYLPPAHVTAAFDALGLADSWIGKGNREDQTAPVLLLRRTAQKTGLLRVDRGRLALTRVGRSVRSDPVALWWRLAERLPWRSGGEIERQASLLALVAIAAQVPGDPAAVILRALSAIGWVASDGSPLPLYAARQESREVRSVLDRIGALTGDYRAVRPTPHGVTFARAALRTWPS